MSVKVPLRGSPKLKFFFYHEEHEENEGHEVIFRRELYFARPPIELLVISTGGRNL